MQRHRNGGFTRTMAAAATGLAVGVVGSRLLSPMFAGVTGSMRASLGGDPFERLMRDHRQIETMLDEMLRSSEQPLARRTAIFVALKRTLGKHALAEEDVVYPILHEEAGAADAARQLYAEHGEMKVHLYELENALKSDAGWAQHVASLRAVIGRHIREEEQVHFPKLHALMDKDRGRTLAGLIRREEALIV
jgi:iron-sulfur cluster repair protein YtfE (RIC family)